MCRLPFFLNSFLCSKKEETEENWRGRWQDPEKSSGLSQPSLPWQHCYFYPVVHGAQSSDFLSSKEARLASALIFQCSTFSKRLQRKKSNRGKGNPLHHPSTRGLFDSGLPLHFGAFGFPVGLGTQFHIFKEITTPHVLPERLLQRKKEEVPLDMSFPTQLLRFLVLKNVLLVQANPCSLERR